MKHILIILAIFMLASSCKSHRDVSRSVVSQTRGESLVTVNDSSRTQLETSLKTDGEKQEDRLEYRKHTEFGADSNVVSTTESVIIYLSNFKFNSKLDQIKRDDFKYSAATHITDTTSASLDEDIQETADSRLIQGWEWAVVIFAIAVVLVILYFVFIKRR